MKNSPSTRPNMVVRQHRDPYHEDYNRFFGASEHEGEIIPWKAPDKISRMRGEIITPSYPLHDPSIANKTFLPNLRQNPCRHPGEQSPNPEDEERMFHGIMARVQSFVVAMLDESNPNSMLFLGEDSALDKPDKNDLLKSIIADFKKTSFSHITPRIKRVDPILDNGMPFIDEHGRPDNTHFYEISSYNWLVGGPLLEYREHPDPRKHINLYEGRNLTYGDLDRSLQPDLAFSSEKLVKIGPQYVDKNEELSETAKRIIGGLIKLAPSITAFGNTIPTSYLRLVPHQEAPTYICWGDKNRSVLIRVPLGWRKTSYFGSKIDTHLSKEKSSEVKQTIELRSPDGSANIHLLLASIAVAAKYGLTNDESLELTNNSYVEVNIFEDEIKTIQERLEYLPQSCFESAEKLKEHSHIYLEDNVFNKRILDGLEIQLKSFKDKNMKIELKRGKEKAENYIKSYFNCG